MVAIRLPRAVRSSTEFNPWRMSRYDFVESSLCDPARVAPDTHTVPFPDCSSTRIVRPATFPRCVSLK